MSISKSEPGANGMIVIQVDGLGREDLDRAMRRGFMPFTRRLLGRQESSLFTTRAGVPATTPAVQAELMYGIARACPGFRWYEKSTGRLRVMKNFEDIDAVRSRLPEERGLFRGGAVYTSFFSGGAERAFFTPGQPDPGQFAGPVKLHQVPLFALRHFIPLARILGLSIYELWLELVDYIEALVHRRSRRSEGLFPLERVAANAVLRELSVSGILGEIKRGTPALFTNLLGFDVMGHHRGPRSLSASMALVVIDRKIRRIWRAARRHEKNGGRHYDLFILSDHGQTPTVPFNRRVGVSLREAILEKEISASVVNVGGAEHREAVQSAAVLSRLRQVQRLLPWPLKQISGITAGRLEARLERSGRFDAIEDATELLVLPTGGLAHIYFLDLSSDVELGDIETAHPGLVDHLAGFPGVRAIVLRDGGETLIRGVGGELRVGEHLHLSGADPLDGCGATEEIARDLDALIADSRSGDLIVLAGSVARRKLVRRGVLYANFLDELGGHGGAEPPEQNSFLICPKEHQALFSDGCRAGNIYEALKGLRGCASDG